MGNLRVLIYNSDPDLAQVWAGFLRREGLDPQCVDSVSEAFEAIRGGRLDGIVLDVDAPDALGVADFAGYRCPDLPVIPVSRRSFFSSGALFQIMPNARSVIFSPAKPDEVAAVAGHYARRYSRRRA